MLICGTSVKLFPANVVNNVKMTSCITDDLFLEELNLRIHQLHEVAPDSIGDLLAFRVVSCDRSQGEYVFRCQTFPWMRNAAGTLHGGMAASIVDQAMGFVAFCIKPGEGFTPTVEMQLSYHRPLFPGEPVVVKVQALSQSRSLIHFFAEVFREKGPEKLCVSGSSVYFFKPFANSDAK